MLSKQKKGHAWTSLGSILLSNFVITIVIAVGFTFMVWCGLQSLHEMHQIDKMLGEFRNR